MLSGGNGIGTRHAGWWYVVVRALGGGRRTANLRACLGRGVNIGVEIGVVGKRP